MTQTTPQPAPPTTPLPITSMPVFKFLAQYIQAAASGDRTTLFHLFVAVFVMARAAVRCLAEHYNAHPRQRTLDTYARLKYCFARIPAILYTIQHAPERFLTPAQLRALTRARTVLAHICNQPVDFSPLTPYLTSPENCPPPPRSVVASASCRHEPCHNTPHTAPAASSADASSPEPSSSPHSALRTSSADPLLLSNPGRVLVSVLLQLAAIYGVSASPVAVPRPEPTPSASLSPRSDLRTPHLENSTPAASPSPRSDLRASSEEAQWPFETPLHPPP